MIVDQLIDAAFVHEIHKKEVMKCSQPFEYVLMWQIQAIGEVILSKIRSVQFILKRHHM